MGAFSPYCDAPNVPVATNIEQSVLVCRKWLVLSHQQRRKDLKKVGRCFLRSYLCIVKTKNQSLKKYTVMKTNNSFENKFLVVIAFMFLTAVIVTFSMLTSFDTTNNESFSHQIPSVGSGKIVLLPSSVVSGMNNQIQTLNKEIAKLEQKRTNLTVSLEQAKSDRNKNLGMVAGLNFQPSQNLSEIVFLEKKISRIDHRIIALNDKKMNINRQIAQSE